MSLSNCCNRPHPTLLLDLGCNVTSCPAPSAGHSHSAGLCPSYTVGQSKPFLPSVGHYVTTVGKVTSAITILTSKLKRQNLEITTDFLLHIINYHTLCSQLSYSPELICSLIFILSLWLMQILFAIKTCVILFLLLHHLNNHLILILFYRNCNAFSLEYSKKNSIIPPLMSYARQVTWN